MTQPLERGLRSRLEAAVKQARRQAEAGAHAALNELGVGEASRPAHLGASQRDLRVRLRAHGRQLGAVRGDLGQLDALALQGFVFATDEIGRVDPFVHLLNEVARRHDGALEGVKRHGHRPARRFQHAPLRIHDDQGQSKDDQNDQPHLRGWAAPE